MESMAKLMLDVVLVCVFLLKILLARFVFFFFSSRRRHTRYWRDWSSDVCSSDLVRAGSAGRTAGAPASGQGKVSGPGAPSSGPAHALPRLTDEPAHPVHDSWLSRTKRRPRRPTRSAGPSSSRGPPEAGAVLRSSSSPGDHGDGSAPPTGTGGRRTVSCGSV